MQLVAAQTTTLRRASDLKARAANVLVDTLVEAGVRVVYGLPGGTIAPIFDALMARPEIRVVITRHESSATFAAIGHARATGELGVVVVTSGPGVLNTMTGVAAAFCDGVPLLVLAGEVPHASFGKGALQEGSPYHLNVIGMARSITKLSAEVVEATAAPAVLRRAMNTALSGKPGPVLLTLPLDVSTATIPVPRLSQSVSTRFEIDEGVLDSAAKALSRSYKKVIFAGNGARVGRGPELLLAVAEQLQCPVITTPKGKGVFPEDHPLCAGIFGMGGHPSAAKLLEGGLETILAIGTSLGDLATNGWSPLLKPERTLIHVDVDAAQVGRVYAAQLGIAASAEVFLEALLPRLPRGPVVGRYGIKTHTDPEALAVGPSGLISPQRALWELQQVMQDAPIYTVDSGEHYFFATHYLQVKRPDGYLVMTGLGAMGTSLGAAMGAQLARPQRRGVAICGDGGFAMMVSELSIAASEGLPVVMVVLNDQRLGMVELGNLAIYGRTPAYPIDHLDVTGAAKAMGARALVIDQPNQILAAAATLHDRSGPLVLDVRIDRGVRMPKNSRFEALAASTSNKS